MHNRLDSEKITNTCGSKPSSVSLLRFFRNPVKYDARSKSFLSGVCASQPFHNPWRIMIRVRCFVAQDPQFVLSGCCCSCCWKMLTNWVRTFVWVSPCCSVRHSMTLCPATWQSGNEPANLCEASRHLPSFADDVLSTTLIDYSHRLATTAHSSLS